MILEYWIYSGKLRPKFPAILETYKTYKIGTCPLNYSWKQLNKNDEPETIYQQLTESMNIQTL